MQNDLLWIPLNRSPLLYKCLCHAGEDRPLSSEVHRTCFYSKGQNTQPWGPAECKHRMPLLQKETLVVSNVFIFLLHQLPLVLNKIQGGARRDGAGIMSMCDGSWSRVSGALLWSPWHLLSHAHTPSTSTCKQLKIKRQFISEGLWYHLHYCCL